MAQASVFSSSYLYKFIIFFSEVMRCSLNCDFNWTISCKKILKINWLGNVCKP